MTNKENQEILYAVNKLAENNSGVAIATVISTWGSSPRPVGSCMIVEENGKFFGSVSGGCIEGEVIENALKSMKDKKPRKLEFGVTNDKAWEVGLACGGNITVYVECLE